MYKNFLVVASKRDPAGINITTQLSQFQDSYNQNFRFYLVDEDIIHTENLDLEKINRFDFIIFASKHQSEKKEKSLTIHVPGNWKEAEHGGTSGKICKSSALFVKQAFQKLNEYAEKHNLRDYQVTLEVTHHGPLIEKPCMFIEIGSTETEWKDKRAAFVIAKTIFDIMKEFKENKYNEIVFGIGGPHYCPNFNKLQLSSNVAIAHIIPKYALPINEEMIKEAVKKTEEEIDFALLDWDGLGDSNQRKQVLEVLDKLYIRYEKISYISRR